MEQAQEMTTTKKKSNPPATKQQSQALALPSDLTGSWGAEESTAEDFIIPKMLLMHGSSKLVQNGKQVLGHIIKSTTGKKLADKVNQVEIIPFKIFKTWVISEKEGNKFVYRREEKYTPENSDQDWLFTGENGNEWKREKALNFYALLRQEILSETEFAIPVKVQFKSTSRGAGMRIANWFSMCQGMGKPPATKSWFVQSDVVDNGENVFQVFAVSEGNEVPLEELKTCKHWYDMMRQHAAKFKEHEDAENEAQEPAQSAPKSSNGVVENPEEVPF